MQQPTELKVTVKNISYNVPILEDEIMSSLVIQIDKNKTDISTKNIELKDLIVLSENLNRELIGRYIYLNGGNFPRLNNNKKV